MSDEYFAGLVDGEGCIGFYPSRNKHQTQYLVSLSVGMTSLACLEALRDRFGGSVQTRKKYEGQNKQQYAWTVCSQKAENAIRAIRPHLIEKRDQADLAVEIREYTRATEKSAEREARLAEYAEQMKALKE